MPAESKFKMGVLSAFRFVGLLTAYFDGRLKLEQVRLADEELA